jgi:very-short-patch-repair endonuclease
MRPDELWDLSEEYRPRDRPTLELAERKKAYAPVFARAVEAILLDLDALCAQTKSPIEELFAIALWGFGAPDNKTVKGPSGAVVEQRAGGVDPFHLLIQPQARVGAYSADFLLTFTVAGLPPASVVVELDGHDFHEKTKTQAAHDKKRDRFFAAQGLTVLRFTGSEVYRDAERCAAEVMSLLAGRTWAASPSSMGAR